MNEQCKSIQEKAKPILFNTEMVRAILDGRKTVTRRVVKNVPNRCDLRLYEIYGEIRGLISANSRVYEVSEPYQPGDILYVRETWAKNADGGYFYKADGKFEVFSWRPSIHMPKEAARILLRVTNVRAERLREITNQEAMDEGFTDWNDLVRVWNSTIKPADCAKYGWGANPWVWVIKFERIDKPEGKTKK